MIFQFLLKKDKIAQNSLQLIAGVTFLKKKKTLNLKEHVFIILF